MPLDTAILGKGVYTPSQAARLIGGRADEVLRWTRGRAGSNPLWHAEYHDLEESSAVSFADLIELRVVKAFRKNGISLQAIRFAIEFAEDKFGVSRPLSSMKFKTDGREILVQALRKEGDGENLVSLSPRRPGQIVFSEIVRQSLSDVEYEDDHVVRWRPAQAKRVVLDPKRQFGAPILDDCGISTKTLYDEYKIFADKKYLASIYEIPLSSVESALKYEGELETNLLNGKSSIRS
jgi:uncharacterized protein (DUF433 family)/GNAT superfamily N-acetyltransferase